MTDSSPTLSATACTHTPSSRASSVSRYAPSSVEFEDAAVACCSLPSSSVSDVEAASRPRPGSISIADVAALAEELGESSYEASDGVGPLPLRGALRHVLGTPRPNSVVPSAMPGLLLSA